MLGGINLIKLDNQIGNTAFVDDTKPAMLLFGPAADELGLGQPTLVNTLAACVALGFTAAYDSTNNTCVYADLSEFFKLNPKKNLYIMLIAQATPLADAVHPENTDGAIKLLNYVNGNCLLAVNRKPPNSYEPSYSVGVDPDVKEAVALAKLLRDYYETLQRPFDIIIGGRGLIGNLGSIDNDIIGTGQGVLVSLLGTASGSLEANVGFVLGWACRDAIHVKLSKTARGVLPITGGRAYLTNGATCESAEAFWAAMDERGFVFPRTYPGQTGYYFSSDSTMAAATSDYNSLVNCRVIHKAIVLLYNALFTLIDADTDLETDGTMPQGLITQLEKDAENKVGQQLAGNASGLNLTLDPTSDLLTEQKLKGAFKVLPKGYTKTIEVTFGFTKSLN